MADYRDELLDRTLLLIHEAGIKEIDTIRSILVSTISDYEISERCTDLAVIDDSNEKMIKEFLATKMIEGGSDETAKNRWYVLRKFNEDVNKPFNEVEKIDVLNWLHNEEKRISLHSADGYRSILKSLFSWLKENEYIDHNPMKKVQPIKHPNVIVKSFTSVEIDLLRSACKNELERTVLELLLSSGIRCEELCSLRWADINFDTKDVTVVEGKGRKSRVTMMDDVTRMHLMDFRDHQKRKCEYIFCRMYRKEITSKTPGAVWREVKEVAERAGVHDVHPHRFRHTFATEKYRRGMDLHMIQRLMGHANVNTTMGYIDGDLESLRDAYKRSM